jgi:outer membrane protein OmpA-like peptidoglycan-associated protein
MMRRVFMLAALTLWCGTADAGQYNFETTAEGMVEKLSRTEPAPAAAGTTQTGGHQLGTTLKFRGIGGFRSVRVIRRHDGGTVEDTMTVPPRRVGYVNLKVLFDVDSFALRPESFPLLDELGKALINPRLGERPVAINGHTDSDGPDRYNLRLSFDRAMAVKSYLTANHGVAPERIEVLGYGESVPLKANSSAANKQLNRRVEVVAAD